MGGAGCGVYPQLTREHARLVGPSCRQAEPAGQAGQVGSRQVGVCDLAPALHHPAPSLGVDEFVDLFASVEDENRMTTDFVDAVGGGIHRRQQHDGLLDQLGVEYDPRSNVGRDGGFRTNLDNVFVAGDMGRGQSLIVWAIAEGRSCAAAVDRHLMETAVNASGLVRRVSRPDLLLLAAIFHDIGKGSAADHSVIGAQMVVPWLERMGVPAPDIAVIVTLIRHHLLLGDTAAPGRGWLVAVAFVGAVGGAVAVAVFGAAEAAHPTETTSGGR